jgi:hypothetical protein
MMVANQPCINSSNSNRGIFHNNCEGHLNYEMAFFMYLASVVVLGIVVSLTCTVVVGGAGQFEQQRFNYKWQTVFSFASRSRRLRRA